MNRRKIPQDGEVGLCTRNDCAKAQAVFPGPHIIVLTDQPLKRAMSSPEAVERMALWAIELSEFDVQYRPRTVVKGQIVANFIAEYTQTEDKGAEGPRL